MKYLIVCMIALLAFENIFSQTGGSTLKEIISKDTTASSSSKALIITSNNLKSGNWQDVITSFYQLAASDLTGKSKSLNFSSNLFALKVKADSTLLIDTNYVKQGFARNFQFNFSLNLDSVFHFSGLNAGFTWAIINKRDSSIIHFSDTYFKKFIKELDSALHVYRLHLRNSNNEKVADSLYQIVKKSVDTMLSNNTFKSENLPADFRLFLVDTHLVDINYNRSDSLFRATLAKVALQPLFTFSMNAGYNNSLGRFNQGSGQFVYLQSLRYKNGSSIEMDLRAGGTLIDTVINKSSVTRELTDYSAGLNVIFGHNNKSFLEVKPYFEYKHVFGNGLLPDEMRDVYLASADLRIRVLNDLWLPLTIQYDTTKGTFLGFLNVSLNLNAFGM